MKKIIIENRNCLYLNHQALIDQQYKQHLASDTCLRFTLKPELFNFKPKAGENAETPKSTKNKRKRKAETENEECVETKSLIEPFLQKLQILVKHKFVKELENVTRLWEETTEFPQFRGANNTVEFQSTQFQQQNYVVPPKCKFYNYNVEDLEKILPDLETYDVIIMDMPWQNKYIKRLKRVKRSLAYQMLDNEHLKKIPIQEFIHQRTLVALWCTNAAQHRRAIEEEFLPLWNLQLVHTLKWFKLNTEGDLISSIKTEGFKQPYELLYIACHKGRDLQDLKEIKKVNLLASIPSIIHSHKPPLVEWLKEFLDSAVEYKGLEIFARYLQPQFTSIGLEVLKLMDKRLYNKIE